MHMFFSANPDEVRKGLYIGGIGTLQAHPYTHVVTAMADCPEQFRPQASCRERLVLPVYDTEDADLLKYLPEAIKFMTDALAAEGTVLVHCAAGVSRSATTVCAYLMASEGLTPDQALASLRQKHRVASPNPGFMAQLRLFHQMKCKLDLTDPALRYHKVEQIGSRWRESRDVDMHSLPEVVEQPAAQDTLYRCRKCRRLVATEANVVTIPEAGSAQKTFHQQWGIRPSELSSSIEEPDGGATSLFVEPLKWMSELESGSVQGKLYCPSCQARLGSFNWAGIRANTGAWVTPAFQLHLNRLDALKPSASPLHALRQPRF